METIRTVIETLYERTEEYSKTSLELAKLKSLETTTVVVSTLISRLSVVVMLSLFVLVLNIGMALWMGELLGKSYYGFFIVAGFYLIAGFIFHFFLHNWIKKPVSKLIITQVLQ
jgi:membrane-associated HD superfamily phosphohydrolase